MRSIRFLASSLFARSVGMMKEFIAPAQRWLPRPKPAPEPARQDVPSYSCYPSQYGPCVKSIDGKTRAMQIDFRFYLPLDFGRQVSIRGRFTNHQWRRMQPGKAEGHWIYAAEAVQPGVYYEFRYLDRSGKEQTATDPLAYRVTKRFDPTTSQYDQFAVAPNLAYNMTAAPLLHE